jgi:hypothetical protein
MVTNMSPFEFVLGKNTKKPKDLTIPMGRKDHSNKTTKMVKRRKEMYTWAKKLLEKA